MVVDKEIIIQNLKKYFLKQTEVIAVYIFGSFNRGTFNNSSDIDVALMLNEDYDKFAAFNLKLRVKEELEKLLTYEVDVIIFSQVNLRLQHQILKGELILGKNNIKRIRREQRAIDQYLDMRYFYDIYEDKLGKGFYDG